MFSIRLVICEKPSVGRSLSAILGASHKRDGFFEGNNHIVTWCLGHLVGLAPPEAYDEKYEKWSYADLPIIPQAWRYTAAYEKKKQLAVLQKLMTRLDVDTVINACDAGREGELIFRLVYDYCACTKPIQRLWISSLEESAIRDGFAKLRPGTDYDTLHSAALCRSQADWIVGLNATRLFSALYRTTLGVGRVQSPTLAMIVERAERITGFKKEAFYTVELNSPDLSASSARISDKAAAEAMVDACNGGSVVIQSVERVEKSVQPPKLYDLTALQREANRMFGYTAQQTLDCVQALYEKKLCTYPRTDSRYITEDMRGGIPRLVGAVAAVLPHLGYADFPVNADRIINDGAVSDHHAVLPTAEIVGANLDALPSAERSVLSMIAVRLLCAVGEKHIYSETAVVLHCGGNEFTAKGKAVISDGWKAVQSAFMASLKGKADNEDEEKTDALPGLSEGQTINRIAATIKEGETVPPKPFTEDTLLSAMECAGAEDMPEDSERKGLGTPATRAGIIEKLIKTGFVVRQKKNLTPTDKAKSLIAVLPDNLKSPALTAEWERKLLEVERGELAASDFMGGIESITRALVTEHNAPKPEFMSLFPSAPMGDAIGKCPRCGGDVHEGKKGFSCGNRACKFAMWKESKFWTAKKKPLTAAIVKALLKSGRVAVKGLYSEKTGKTYDATVVLDDTGNGYVNFKLSFD